MSVFEGLAAWAARQCQRITGRSVPEWDEDFARRRGNAMRLGKLKGAKLYTLEEREHLVRLLDLRDGDFETVVASLSLGGEGQIHDAWKGLDVISLRKLNPEKARKIQQDLESRRTSDKAQPFAAFCLMYRLRQQAIRRIADESRTLTLAPAP